MVDRQKQSCAVERLRELAHRGLLAAHYSREAAAEERQCLRAGALEIAWPLVFFRITRPIERKRGHHMCTIGVQRLEPDCLDRFHDDVEAVVDDLFARADLPIENLEGWLSMRLPRATVDGHRKRRGRREALQRPRVPNWLADALDRDPWLVELAKSILDWVGVEVTAGNSLWPLTAWAERRGMVTRSDLANESMVAAEIEVVLAAMRRRATWYDRNVERPLGHKRTAVHFPSRAPSGGYTEPEPFVPVARHEKDDALLLELADRSIVVMKKRMHAGEDLQALVADVVSAVFGAAPVSRDLDRQPGDDTSGPEQVVMLISDPDRLNRVVETVVELLRPGDRPSEPA